MSSLAQISRVKHVLDRNQLVKVINALVFSKLLYCSSNTSNKNICRLQSVHNFVARIITGTRKFAHITPVLRDLRWFPVKQNRTTRININRININPNDYYNPVIDYYSPVIYPLLRFEPCLDQLGLLLILWGININQININPNIRSSNRLL